MPEVGTTLERPAQPPAPIRHLRWLVPLAVALLAFVIFALVEALHESKTMGGSKMIQTAGFYKPNSTSPVPFSLPILQAAGSAQPNGSSSVTMASLRGKPVVLNLWSSSCTICKAEAPAMESVASRVGHAVTFVGIDTMDQRGTALGFLHRYHVTYLQLFDPAERVGSGYGIAGFPVTVFVSDRGKVVGEYLGGLSRKTLGHYLKTLFAIQLPPS